MSGTSPFPTFRLLKHLPHYALLCLLIAISALAQTHSGFPVDIVAGPSPQPVMADGRAHLVYELHLTNYVPVPINLTSIEVLGNGATLASYSGLALEKLVIPVEKLSLPSSPSLNTGTQTIAEGHSAVIFVDLVLDSGARMPAELHHRFSFSVTRSNGEIIKRTLDAPTVPVVQEPPLALQPPLRGSIWVAFNALGAEDHRRSLNAVDGRERIPERFAIDWMRLGPDGRLFHDDAKSNANFYGYGAEVLAAADARVSDLKDGIAENVGTTDRDSRAITLENAVGNYIILDLGHRRFALYAHLQPGTLKVKIGDAVKTGQVLALLGNSGNSDAPHLHFQLMDANSPLGAEGISYELETFTQLGTVPDDPDVQDNGQPLLLKSQEKPTVRRREFPLDNAALSFP